MKTTGDARTGTQIVRRATGFFDEEEMRHESMHSHLAAMPVRHSGGADISDKIEPRNNLMIEQGRTLAAQTTQVQVSQFLSTFAAGLGLGLNGGDNVTFWVRLPKSRSICRVSQSRLLDQQECTKDLCLIMKAWKARLNKVL